MMLNKQNIQLILQLAIVALLTCLLIPGFRGKSQAPYPSAIKAYDLLLEEKERHLQTIREWKDREIREGMQKDSLLAISFNQHQKVYEPIKKNLAAIPARIQRISGNDDSIRAAFAN